MADPQYLRVPLTTLAPDPACDPASLPASAQARPPASLSVLSVHFLTPAGQPAADKSAAVNLATDLIRASGGTLQAGDSQALTASFPSLTVAVLIARRLHWALQGLAESAAQAGAAIAPAAILIQSAHEAADAAPPPAGAGQILLSPAATAAVLNLPGVSLRATTSNWSALLSHSANQPASFAADESALLGLIRDCGREDPCLPKTRSAPSASPSNAIQPAPAPNPASTPSSPGFSSILDRLGPPPRRWFILGGAAAVLIALIAVVAIASHPRTTPTKAAAQSAGAIAPAASSFPSTPSASSATTAAPPPSAAPVVKSVPTGSRKTPPPDSHPKKGTDTASCDFTDAGIPRALSRAETDMHDGHLDEAKAAFLKLRACAAARDRAEEDLRTVQRKIDTQSLARPN
jgi:hypothetical protein